MDEERPSRKGRLVQIHAFAVIADNTLTEGLSDAVFEAIHGDDWVIGGFAVHVEDADYRDLPELTARDLRHYHPGIARRLRREHGRRTPRMILPAWVEAEVGPVDSTPELRRRIGVEVRSEFRIYFEAPYPEPAPCLFCGASGDVLVVLGHYEGVDGDHPRACRKHAGEVLGVDPATIWKTPPGGA